MPHHSSGPADGGALAERSSTITLLALAFILSGAAGLIYESIWSRYLGLFVGHSAYAQIIVLVIFLGGMSIGAFAAGERSERLRRPLLWYAGVELLVGAIGFGFHHLFVVVSGAAYDHWFPALAGQATGAGSLAFLAVKWGLAGLLILPQSILLGATFPLMSAGAVRLAGDRTGHTLGLLYFANSLGAAVGVLLAGFVLLAAVGLPGTLTTAAVLNVVVAVGVGMLEWGMGTGDRGPGNVRAQLRGASTPGHPEAVPPNPEPRPPAPGPSSPHADASLQRLLLFVSFGTAIASFVYEIAWIRMLSLVLGSATHSFELMLSAFILGLALGAFWVRGRADTFARPLRTLGVVQCVMGSLAVATLPLYLASFRWTAALIAMLRQNDAGYHGFVVARYGFCLLVMLPATFCAGITLPLITRTLLAGGVGERAIGAVYGVNTLGSIVGVVLAGLVLMPVLGLKWLLIAGAAVDVGVGAVVLTWDTGHGTRDTGSGERRFPRSFRVPDPESRIPVVLAVIVLVAAALLTNLDRSVLTSGVYRRGYITEPGSMHFDFYRDGRTATVSVRRVASDTNAITTLATNGKPDASMDAEWRRPQPPGAPPLQLRRDIATQVLLPVITLAHAPWAREVAVIGHGSGMTSHFLLGSPAVRRVTTIEIEPEMIAAARAFLPANHRVYDDARSRFVVDDARSVFATSGHRYDLILSEPSNPWVSGVSGLFTEEFYGRVRRQLAPGGVFGQWLHLYEIDDALVTTVLAAIDRVFPSYEVFFTSNVDILVVAGNGARVPAPDWSVVRDAGIAEDLRRVVPIEPGHFEAMRLAGRDVLHRYLASRPAVNSDFHPLLDLGAERTRFLQSSAEGIGGLGEGDLDLVAALAGRRRAPVSAPIAPVPEIPRVAALAVGARVRALRDAPPELLRAAAERLPDDDDARLALYRLGAVLRAVRDGGSPPGDWLLWTHQVADVAHALDGGTAGVADEGFYTTVRAGAAAAHAPPGARAALDFLHGVAAWDWAEAARAGDVLIAERRAGTAWLSTDLLREGAALAHVQLGDPAGARAVFRSLAPFGEAAPLRERLLAARVLELERKR